MYWDPVLVLTLKSETQDEPPYKPPRRQSPSEVLPPWLPSQAETPKEKSHDKPAQDISGFSKEFPKDGNIPVDTESSIKSEQWNQSFEPLPPLSPLRIPEAPPHVDLPWCSSASSSSYSVNSL